MCCSAVGRRELGHTYPWDVLCERLKPVLEVVGDDNGLKRVLALVVGARLGGLLALTSGATLARLLGHVVCGFCLSQSILVELLWHKRD